MTKYIFNFKAINIVPEAIAGAGSGVGVIEAKNVDDALDKARERWARNRQFRFEYRYVGSES